MTEENIPVIYTIRFESTGDAESDAIVAVTRALKHVSPLEARRIAVYLNDRFSKSGDWW